MNRLDGSYSNYSENNFQNNVNILKKRNKEIYDTRKNQVGTGDRSEKIRTYNFPQSRVTDHRLNENFHNIAEIMEGQIDEILEHLRKLRVEEKLKHLSL